MENNWYTTSKRGSLGYQSTQVMVLVEADPEQVKDFALEEIGARPDRHQRVQAGIFAGNLHLQAQVGLVGNGEQLVHDLEAGILGIPVHAGDVGQGVVL